MQNNKFFDVLHFTLQVNNCLHLLQKGVSTWSRDHSLVAVLWWIPAKWQQLLQPLRKEEREKRAALWNYWMHIGWQDWKEPKKMIHFLPGGWKWHWKVSILSVIFTPFWDRMNRVPFLRLTPSIHRYMTKNFKLSYPWNSSNSEQLSLISTKQQSWCYVDFAALTQLTLC